MHIKRAVFLN